MQGVNDVDTQHPDPYKKYIVLILCKLIFTKIQSIGNNSNIFDDFFVSSITRLRHSHFLENCNITLSLKHIGITTCTSFSFSGCMVEWTDWITLTDEKQYMATSMSAQYQKV